MSASEHKGERIAKVMARAGLCSRRDAESWIAAGRVAVNGEVLTSAARNITRKDVVLVDGKPLPGRQQSRVWLYHKPKGLVTTARDPQGRPTVFEKLPPELPRVISVGRLDLNSEGLLLLTNDGELARHLELPSTGWSRRYRVRVNGRVDEKLLARLADGIEIDGVRYGAIEARLARQQGDNAWLDMALKEGKNREIRRVCEHFHWPVSRLIRVAYGPFALGDLVPGAVREVKGRVLKLQLKFGDAWDAEAAGIAEEAQPLRKPASRPSHEKPPSDRPQQKAGPDEARRGKPGGAPRPKAHHKREEMEAAERPARQKRRGPRNAGQQKPKRHAHRFR